MQDYKDIEHIILDDCSDDKTPKFLRSLNIKNLRCIYSDKRLKCGSAYNRLSHEASGDIVCVLDADDVLVKKAVSKIVSLYRSNIELDYIWTQFWLCDSKLRKIKTGVSRHPGEMSLLDAGLNGQHCFSHWRTFKRKVLEKGEIFQIGLSSAVDKFMGYSLEEIGPGGFTKTPLYKYRQRVGGLSFTGRKNWEKMKIDFLQKRTQNSIKPFPIKKLSEI